MITPSYAITATERVLPRMALDFTTASLDSRVTVTRALNTATRVNSSGYIEAINANLPRFDYSPISVGVCKGLLIEETRANLAIKSSDFDDSVVWARTNVDVTPNAINSPDGTSNADKIIETAGTAGHLVLQAISPSLTSGVTYTYSVFLKKAEREFAFVVLSGSAFSATVGVSVNLTTGVASTATGSPVFTQPELAANGFWRVNITSTAASSATGGCSVYLSNNGSWGSRAYIGDGTSGIYAYGAQLEAGAFATSYIPTTTTSLTRNADSVGMTGTNFSSWYSSTTGAILAEWDVPNITGTKCAYYLTNAAETERIRLHAVLSGINRYTISSSGSTIVFNTAAAATGVTKTVVGFKASDYAVSFNGATVATNTTLASVPTTPDQLQIGRDGASSYLNGWMRRVAYWPQRLINSEVQSFAK